jgi:5-methylcytosine-specific restriction endonuclease McrA
MSKRTTYHSIKAPEVVWNKAATIRGKDPDLYRKDPYGNELYKHSYGKNSIMGWQVDHIKPQSHGGSHDIRNLQALQTQKNREKSDSLKKASRHKH